MKTYKDVAEFKHALASGDADYSEPFQVMESQELADMFANDEQTFATSMAQYDGCFADHPSAKSVGRVSAPVYDCRGKQVVMATMGEVFPKDMRLESAMPSYTAAIDTMFFFGLIGHKPQHGFEANFMGMWRSLFKGRMQVHACKPTELSKAMAALGNTPSIRSMPQHVADLNEKEATLLAQAGCKIRVGTLVSHGAMWVPPGWITTNCGVNLENCSGVKMPYFANQGKEGLQKLEAELKCVASKGQGLSDQDRSFLEKMLDLVAVEILKNAA
jgi:hypothetical protein